MANQFLTGTQIEALARLRSDTVQLTDRHLSADILTETNLSFMQMREDVSIAGAEAYLEPTSAAPLSTTPGATSEQYSEVDWPLDFTSIHRVDVLQGGEWYKLTPASFSQQRELIRSLRMSYGWDGPPNPPYWYTPRKIPTASGATPAVGKVMVFPLPIAGQQYRLWGLQAWEPLTNPAHVFPGHSNWLDWVINDVAIKLVRRDNNAQGTLDGLIKTNEALKASIARQCRILNADGPTSPSPRPDAAESCYWPRMIP